MKKVVVFAACVVMLASLAMASNTGFKLNYTLHWTSGYANTNWVSLPYFYYPDGNINNATQKSSAICADINATNGGDYVASVQRFDVLSNSQKTNPCLTSVAFDFTLNPGDSYAVVPKNQDNVRFDVVGSHDDDFDTTKGVTLHWTSGYANTNWVSVPYHTTLTKSSEICTEINTQTGVDAVASVQRFDVTSNSQKTNPCLTSVAFDFNLVPGEGYAVVPKQAGNDGVWHPSHY
jgi:archaellum component FlaF (FlaF/FlaG flagellin family)